MSDDTPTATTSTLSAVELATGLTIAWLGNPNTPIAADDAPAFLQAMHDTVTALGSDTSAEAPGDAPPSAFEPAVSVRKSLASKAHILSMINGKPYKTLRRHLSTNGLTPEEYRARYNLKPDYPMVAETYSESRRALAKTMGLGRTPALEAPPAETASKAKPASRKRLKIA